jgi:hypothetical protein
MYILDNFMQDCWYLRYGPDNPRASVGLDAPKIPIVFVVYEFKTCTSVHVEFASSEHVCRTGYGRERAVRLYQFSQQRVICTHHVADILVD